MLDIGLTLLFQASGQTEADLVSKYPKVLN